MKKYFHLTLGILLGLSLGFSIGRHYGMRVQGEMDQLQQSRHRVEVIAARANLPEGVILKRTDLAAIDTPDGVVTNPVYVQDVDHIVGKKTLNPLEAGQCLHWSDIQAGAVTNR